MNTYKVSINFRNGKALYFEMNSEKDIRETIADSHAGKGNTIFVGEYIIAKEDIRWIRVEGETLLEEPSRKELQDTGKKE